MSPRIIADASALPIFHSGHRNPLWWGMIFLVTIESVVFATFGTTFLYFRFSAPEWPPPGIDPPDLLLPTLNTVVLICSSLVMAWADQGIKKGDVKRLKVGLAFAMALGVLFLVLKVVEYAAVDYYWHTNAYGSIVWTIVIFHSAHVLSVLLKGAVVEVLAFRGHFTAERNLGVQINGIYWHFVVVIWIPLYILLYWVPRLG